MGYAAGGVGAGLLAALVAFTPSFAFVIFGAPYFGWLRSSTRIHAFLTGAGAAAIGAIAGAAIPRGQLLVRQQRFRAIYRTLLLIARRTRTATAHLVSGYD